GRTNDSNEETVINDESTTFTQANDFVENTVNNVKRQDKGTLVGLTIGIILIVFGFYILSAKILHIDWMRFIFPILLIGTGLIILISSMNSKNKNNA
ncbi:MAG: hypothetical protein LBV02_03530, partial [Bacteroidales bacterium]|nr:hypothetical protein [Bacteroidales bacterium]